jgi:hypothetical protein
VAQIKGIGKVPSKGMGIINGSGAETAGLSIMAAMSVAGIWSALSPSYFTYSVFAKSEKEKAIGQKTLFVSAGAGLITSLGIYLVFGKLIPAIAGVLTTVGLFAMGQHALSQTDGAPVNPSMSPNDPPLKGIGNVKATCVGCKEQVNLAGREGERLGVRCLYCGNIYCKECAHQHFKQDAHDARHMGKENFRQSAHEESEKTTGTFRSPMPGESPYDSSELGPVHKSYHVGQPDAMVVS